MNTFNYLRERWTGQPLVARLTILVTFLLGLGMVVSGTVMVSLLQRHLIDQVDTQLYVAAKSISTNKTAAPFVAYSASPTPYYILVESVDTPQTEDSSYGYIIETAGKPIIPRLLPRDSTLEPETTTQAVTLKSDKPGSNWRAVSFAFDVDNRGRTSSIITVALPLTDIQQTMRTTTSYFLLVGIFIVVVGGLLGAYLVRHSLAPLRAIESTAGKIAAGDFTQRIESEPSTTEVGSLARSLNTMLAQVERAFATKQESEEKTHRFVSDASHELRTPLAAIRGYGELFAMGGIPNERVPEVMGRIHDEATRMGTLVEDLLTLARLDEGRPLEFSEIDLVKMAENAAFDMRALDPSRIVTISGLDGEEPAPSVSVCADRDRIQQVFTNLVGNIARYTPKGTPVELCLGERNGFAVVEFRDHGPGIRQQDRELVFERFYRAEDSRARSLGGSGLGLAIVSGILQAHRGTAELSKTDGGGLTVTISLPLDHSADTPPSTSEL